jgi:hypothetical protein
VHSLSYDLTSYLLLVGATSKHSTLMAPVSGTSGKPKGTHGGRRPGSGRKPKDQTLGNPRQKTTAPPQAGASTASTMQASTSQPRNPVVQPAAFFLPYKTNRPVPRGNFVTAGTRTSFWATVGPSRPEAATNTSNSENTTSSSSPHYCMSPTCSPIF